MPPVTSHYTAQQGQLPKMLPAVSAAGGLEVTQVSRKIWPPARGHPPHSHSLAHLLAPSSPSSHSTTPSLHLLHPLHSLAPVTKHSQRAPPHSPSCSGSRPGTTRQRSHAVFWDRRGSSGRRGSGAPAAGTASTTRKNCRRSRLGAAAALKEICLKTGIKPKSRHVNEAYHRITGISLNQRPISMVTHQRVLRGAFGVATELSCAKK